MLRKRVLATIEATPGITIAELRAQLPELTRRQIHNALQELRASGRIEAAEYGRYRVPTAAPRPSTAGRGQVVPMHKLMAGR